MRSVSPQGPERLDISAMPVTARSQAIAALLGEPVKASKRQARKIEPSDAATRCRTCGHVDQTCDQGQAMDRHIERAHKGAGGSSMVL